MDQICDTKLDPTLDGPTPTITTIDDKLHPQCLYVLVPPT
jgi:hypothetical protein